MVYQEDDYLMLSGLQHFYFCKRQWGLIHIEQQWAENKFTSEGKILHEKTDNPTIKEKRKNIFISRAMKVSSQKLGLSGILDVVEFHKDNTGVELKNKKGYWKPVIIEYKRGKPKKDNRDIIQLVAEVMCLEETLLCEINHSYLYYHSVNKKEKIIITKELRNMVKEMAYEMHTMYETKMIPKAEYFKNCKLCSLYDICLPRISKKPKSIENYISSSIESEEYI